MKLDLSNVTLAGVDCLNIQRLVEVSKICEKQITFGSVKLFSSQNHRDPNVVKIPHISYEEISEFLMRKLNSFIDTEYVLIIEHDGYILNPQAWANYFFHFDYIGAPWWYTDGMNVGNGGFSFRSKKLCEVLATDPRIRQFHGEDFHICRTYRRILEEQGIRFAPECVARKFSFEGNPRSGLRWNGQFGFHHYFQSNLDNWHVHKNVNRFSDKRFLRRFKQKTRARVSVKPNSETLKRYRGKFIANDGQCVLEVYPGRDRLVVKKGAIITQFLAFNDQYFFSDSSEEILEFMFLRGYCILIVYSPSGKVLFGSKFFFRKENLK